MLPEALRIDHPEALRGGVCDSAFLGFPFTRARDAFRGAETFPHRAEKLTSNSERFGVSNALDKRPRGQRHQRARWKESEMISLFRDGKIPSNPHI